MENAKIKIFFVITKGAPFGGAQKYVFDLATSLPKDRFEPVVVCGVGSSLPERLAEKNIRVIQIEQMGRDVSLRADMRSYKELLWIFRSERPDIVHVNSPKAAGLGALAARVAHIKKIIYTVHGWSFNEQRSALSNFLIRIFSWITVSLSHETIVIAQREYDQAVTWPEARKKLHLIHNGIRPIDFFSRGESRKILSEKIANTIESVPENTQWIGTIAELHSNKNLPVLVDALTQVITPFVWIIIGNGEEREYLAEYIEKKKLSHKILLAGSIEHASRLLHAFDFFVLPSIKEGLPYTLLEAGMAGLPCLASRVGGIPDIIENEVDGITVIPTMENLRTALDFLFSHPQEANAFASHLQEKVLRNFSFDEMLQKIQEIYLQ